MVGFPRGPSGKEPACQSKRLRDASLIPGLGRSPGGGHGNPLQYSCLEYPRTEEPGMLQSRGSQSDMTEATQHSTQQIKWYSPRALKYACQGASLTHKREAYLGSYHQLPFPQYFQLVKLFRHTEMLKNSTISVFTYSTLIGQLLTAFCHTYFLFISLGFSSSLRHI